MRYCFQVRLTNEVNADICFKYWSIGDDLNYEFWVRDLAAEMQLTEPVFVQLIMSSSVLECRCEVCQEIFKTYHHRTALNKDKFDYQKTGHIVCRSCWFEFGKSTTAQQIAAENKELKELVVKLTQDMAWVKKEIIYFRSPNQTDSDNSDSDTSIS